MEQHIEKLEEFAADAKARLVRIEVRLDGIDKRLDGAENRMATKADLAAGLATLEATLIKWFVATAITLTSLVFVVVRFVK